MDDKGEKIVFLARELLNAGIPEIAAEKKSMDVTMTFRALCLTTFIAAAGSGLVTAWIHEQDRPLTRYEKTEIEALIFYTSRLKGIEESTLRRDVSKQLGLVNLNDMTSGEFSIAQRYLQEKAQ